MIEFGIKILLNKIISGNIIWRQVSLTKGKYPPAETFDI